MGQSVLALLAIALVLGLGNSDAGRRVAAACQPGQVAFFVETQPMNSLTTGFGVVAKTVQRGLTCTVVGYPSLTLPDGTHGAITIEPEPHLLLAKGPVRVVTLTASQSHTGGFYVINHWSCDKARIHGRVRFGLPGRFQRRGSALMTLCRTAPVVIELGPFTK